MEITNRKSIHTNLKKFAPYAKDSSFIQITEWTNAEGIDINIDERILALSYDELEGINYLQLCLRYGNEG